MDEYLDDKGNVAFTEGVRNTLTKRVFKPIAYFGNYTVYEESVVVPVVVPVSKPDCLDCEYGYA